MHTYSTLFFASQRDESRRSARGVVPILIDLIAPRSVVDVGCGIGTWASVFADHGTSAYGIDGDYVDRGSLLIPAGRFLPADLTRPLEDGPEGDLAVCLEVGEHLPESAAPTLVETLTGTAPVVAFSAAIPEQGGTDHINEQWQSWWATLFAREGYVAVDALHDRVWALEGVSPWYRQNMVLYVRETELGRYPKLAGCRVGPPRDVVHPDFYLLAKVSPVGVKGWARTLPREVRWTAARRVRRARSRIGH